MFGISPGEMLIVGVVAVILFGSRLPSVARSFGKSIIEFKKGMRDVEDDLRSTVYSEPAGRVSCDKSSKPANVATGQDESESADVAAEEEQPVHTPSD